MSEDLMICEDEMRFEIVGRGQIELPGRSVLRSVTSTIVGDEPFVPDEGAVLVNDDGREYERCEGEAEFRPILTEDDRECRASGVDPETFGPEPTIDLIQETGFASSGITEIGTDTMPDGSPITGYQTVQPITLDSGETIDATVQIWIDDQSLIRRVVSSGSFLGGEDGYPTTLVMAFDLNDFGSPVDIPDVD